MRKFIVDRIEGDKAVLECENGTFVEMEVASLPKNLKEGDVIRFKAKRRRQKIQRLMEQVFEDEQ